LLRRQLGDDANRKPVFEYLHCTIHWRLKAAAKEQGATSAAASAASLAESPTLRFLAWQDEWKDDQVGGARHPDGSEVTDETEIRLLRSVSPGRCDVSATESGKRHPRFLHLWFSHPLFDHQSYTEIALFDGAGQPIPLGADGTMSSNTRAADQGGNLGWLTQTVSPGEGDHIPRIVTIRLRYTIGLLERQHQIATDNNGIIAIEGSGQINGIGQDAAGKAFIAIAFEAQKTSQRRLGAIATTKDGRELEPVGSATGGNSNGTGVSIARFRFDVPLSDIAHFRVGTRPVRTMEWKDVVLPTESK
jgi:hypothetical protein